MPGNAEYKSHKPRYNTLAIVMYLFRPLLTSCLSLGFIFIWPMTRLQFKKLSGVEKTETGSIVGLWCNQGRDPAKKLTCHASFTNHKNEQRKRPRISSQNQPSLRYDIVSNDGASLVINQHKYIVSHNHCCRKRLK